MTYQDWIDVVEKKCPKARAKMFKYCPIDVLRLDEVAKRIMPYVTTTASRAVARRDPTECSNVLCDRPHVIKSGIMTTLRGRFQKYRCTSCGHNHIGGKV